MYSCTDFDNYISDLLQGLAYPTCLNANIQKKIILFKLILLFLES